jgi:hypothetical protein
VIEVITKQGQALCYSDETPDDDEIEEGYSTFNETLKYTRKSIVLPCKQYLPLIGDGNYLGTCNHVVFNHEDELNNDTGLRHSTNGCRSIVFEHSSYIDVILQRIIDDKLHIDYIKIEEYLNRGIITAFESDGLAFNIYQRSTYNCDTIGVTIAELVGNWDKEINTDDMTMVVLPEEFLVSANLPDSTARYTHLVSEVGYCHGELEDGRAIVRVTERVDGKYRTKSLYIPPRFLKYVTSWTKLSEDKNLAEHEPCNMVYLNTAYTEIDGITSRSLRIYYSKTNGQALSMLQSMSANRYETNGEVNLHGTLLARFAKEWVVYTPKYSDEDTLGALNNRDLDFIKENTTDYSIKIHTISNIFTGVGYRKAIKVKHLKMEYNDILSSIKQELIDDEANRKVASARIMNELDMNKIYIGSSQTAVDTLLNSVIAAERSIKECEDNIQTYINRARDYRLSLARYNEQLLIAKGILEAKKNVDARTHIPTLFDQLEFVNTNNSGVLYFLTEPIKLERDGQVADCGRLLLGINFYSQSAQNLVKVHRGIDCKDHSVSQYFHPHVNGSGSICFGAVLPRVNELFVEGNVSAIITYVRSLLYTFNADSPYINWTSFMAIPNKIGQSDELINITKGMK